MKKLILVLFCLTLTTAAAWAKDYHLVETQLRGAPRSGTPAMLPIVYVLMVPYEAGQLTPLVYNAFDSRDM